MYYDAEKLIVEEIPSFAAFVRLIRPAYARPEIRKRGNTLLRGFELVEVYDAATNACLGDWNDDSFDFAGASSEVIDRLDEHLRIRFKMKKRVPRRMFNSKGVRNVGRDFIQFLGTQTPKRLTTPRRIETLDDFYRLVSNAKISVGLMMGPILRSTHNFEVYQNHIEDDSMVDGSFTKYTKRQFEKSFYAVAITRGAMVLEEIFSS
jgi:hypothetical protein